MINFLPDSVYELENEHKTEHEMKKKLPFSSPKIYTAQGDLKKRWYVYFSYVHPDTGRKKRVKNIYGIANRYKTKEERLYVLTMYRKNLLTLLKEGYNPFKDNTELYEKQRREEETIKTRTKETVEEDSSVVEIVKAKEIQREEAKQVNQPAKTLKESLELGLVLKSKTVGARTLKDYTHKVHRFLKWLSKYHPEIKYERELTKSLIHNYLNEVLIKTSARNRNNTRCELSSVFEVLKENEIVKENYFQQIKKLRTKVKAHKVYSAKEVETIFKHLEEHDPILLFYIKFLSITLMRPIEVCRLKVGDINLEENTIRFKAKNSALKTKIIPRLLLDEFPDLKDKNKDDYLFTPQGVGGVWDTSEENKRSYFTKRFKKEVKEKFSLTTHHTLYGFRHTYITMLYRKLREQNSPHQVKSDLMLITGHTSMKALESYLRTIDAELPKDYSNLLE